MDKIIEAFTSEQLKTDVPQFRIGDTVRVHNKIKEGTRERVQLFEGTVIARKSGGISETFTVRRVAYGVGVEKTFPLHSPNVEKVEVIRRGKVRRAKLYYVRDRVGKSAKVKEKNLTLRLVSAKTGKLLFCVSSVDKCAMQTAENEAVPLGKAGRPFVF